MPHNAEKDAWWRRTRPRIRAGRLTLWLWSGSWSRIDHEDCAHCRNVYVGPFGIEWERPLPPGEDR